MNASLFSIGLHGYGFVGSIAAIYFILRVPMPLVQLISCYIFALIFFILEWAQSTRLDVQSWSKKLSPLLQANYHGRKILRFRRRRQLQKPQLITSSDLYDQTPSSFLVFLDNLLDTLATILLWKDNV